MIFVDSNVFIYAVGRPHPLRAEAQSFFKENRLKGRLLVTSAEVLQELLHAYLPVDRMETLDNALELASTGVNEVIPITLEVVLNARHLASQHVTLTSRDLLHLSVCRLHNIPEIKTFEKNLRKSFFK